MSSVEQVVADAIRAAAAGNGHCSYIPGPVVAELYARAAIQALNRHGSYIVENWHGQVGDGR